MIVADRGRHLLLDPVHHLDTRTDDEGESWRHTSRSREPVFIPLKELESRTIDHTIFWIREEHTCARGVVQVITCVRFPLFRNTFTDYNFAAPALAGFKKTQT